MLKVATDIEIDNKVYRRGLTSGEMIPRDINRYMSLLNLGPSSLVKGNGKAFATRREPVLSKTILASNKLFRLAMMSYFLFVSFFYTQNR